MGIFGASVSFPCGLSSSSCFSMLSTSTWDTSGLQAVYHVPLDDLECHFLFGFLLFPFSWVPSTTKRWSLDPFSLRPCLFSNLPHCPLEEIKGTNSLLELGGVGQKGKHRGNKAQVTVSNFFFLSHEV